MGRLRMKILEGELFVLYLVVVDYGCILYNMNGYITAIDYTILVSVHSIVLY